jgi:hypothetical protein
LLFCTYAGNGNEDHDQRNTHKNKQGPKVFLYKCKHNFAPFGSLSLDLVPFAQGGRGDQKDKGKDKEG